MKIAVEGCAHGELDAIYSTLQLLEETEQIKVDLLICCGDFQSTRNEADLKCMAVPAKFAKLCTFYKYYNGEKTAPVLTIFIGGNHEASNYLQELPYGGWVAPNIYYLGYAGVINVAGIRIAGLSGIYKNNDYMRGHYETTPYNDNSKRSVYHIRNLEVFRLKQLSGPLDICLSHDWPAEVYNYGNTEQLLRNKPFFRDDINSGKLGSPPAKELLQNLKPSYWFAAHLHCKFAAFIPHDNDKHTRFLSLDKCLPKRRFLQIVNIAHDTSKNIEINYDLEWLTILYLTNHLLNVRNTTTYMPGSHGNERWEFTPTDKEKDFILERLKNDLVVPKNFVKSAVGFNGESPQKFNKHQQPEAVLNPQTVLLCETLSIDDPVTLVKGLNNMTLSFSESVAEINTSTFNGTEISLTSPVKSRTSLILPEPKLSASEEIDVSELNLKDNSLEKSFEGLVKGASLVPPEPVITDVIVSLGENFEGKCLDVESVNNDSSKIEECSSVKKFKRRNAEMYKAE